MQVAKWGNSLAVRLPASVVEALDLKPGDDIQIHVGATAPSRSRERPARANCSRGSASTGGDCQPTSSSTASSPMNGGDGFFDTNVLLYLLSADSAKADRAEELLASGGRISVQVLNEFVAVATRKLRMPLAEVREVLDSIRAVCAVEPLSIETHDRALDIAQRYGLSIYDALIVSAALLAACNTLHSEDMQDGLVIDRRLDDPRSVQVALTSARPPVRFALSRRAR